MDESKDESGRDGGPSAERPPGWPWAPAAPPDQGQASWPGPPAPSSQPDRPGQSAEPGQSAQPGQSGGSPQPAPGGWEGPPPGPPIGPPIGPPPAGPYPGYGYPHAYGGAPSPVARPNAGGAVAVGVLGIGSLVLFFTCLLGFIPAIIALVMAPGAHREIAQSGGRVGGEGLIRAGRICAWITLGLTALVVLAVIVGLAVAVSVGTSGRDVPAALGL